MNIFVDEPEKWYKQESLEMSENIVGENNEDASCF